MDYLIILELVGGLGLFLYGMKVMSESLQRVAGNKLRSVLATLTKNRFMGLITGALFTAIIQSSSATTVMVVSFVNAKLLTLVEAAGLILGANIGTTITSVLISFKLENIAPICVILGVVIIMFTKSKFLSQVSEVIIGFGILFMGLAAMSSAMGFMKDSPVVMNVLSGISNPLIAFVVGVVITAIMQSSSATIGVLQVAVYNGMLPLNIGLYVMLGCNIGTCITAIIASIGAKKDAKRASYIHFIVNVIGQIISFGILLVASKQVINMIQIISGDNLMGQIATAHVCFKIFEMLLILPFVDKIVQLTYKIVPGEDVSSNTYCLEYLGNNIAISKAGFVPNIVAEIKRMGNMAISNLDTSIEAVLNKDLSKKEEIEYNEGYIDYLDEEINKAIVTANQMGISIQDRNLLGSYFHIVSDIERIGDHAQNVLEEAEVVVADNIDFSDKGIKEIRFMKDAAIKCFKYSIQMFDGKNDALLSHIKELEELVDDMEKIYSGNHIKRMSKGQCGAKAGIAFNDIITSLERVADHSINIAVAIANPEEAKYSIHNDNILNNIANDEYDDDLQSRIESMMKL